MAKLRAALLFLVFSVAAGVVAAGLSVPMVLVGTSMVNTTAKDWSNVPLELITPPQMQASKVYMKDGSLLTTFSDEYRDYVPLSDISLWMQRAQVAIEDHRFYQHGAIDPIGLIRAAIGHAVNETDRGASSITQQYVKMVRVQIAIQNKDKDAQKAATEQTLSRKIIEMRYAIALEEQLTKDQILERYLNMAYYGDQTYGVEAAAQHYFGVSAKDLNLPQAAMLAGLVQSPGATDPVHNPDAAVARRDVVLDRMADADVGVITPLQAAEAKAVPWDPKGVVSLTKGCANSEYPFLCDYVYRTLISDKMTSLGATSDERKTMLAQGGLEIHTLIDPVAQASAQKAVSNLIDPRDPVVGVVVLLEPSTGLIIAMAQSRPVMGADSKDGETFWNYAVDNNMGGGSGFQAGSTFKAFTLANALSLGVPYGTQYLAPASINLTGQKFMSCSGSFPSGRYNPHGGAGGPISLLNATVNSINTFYVQLERDTSICGAVKMAQRAGVHLAKAQNGGTDLIKNLHADGLPAFTLGPVEVSPLTMASAYGTFANKGKHCDPIILKSITDQDGKDLAVPSANCTQTIDPNIAAGVDVALQQVMARGTGSACRLPGGYPQAGKSGTTNNNEVTAFAGYTPNVVGFATIAPDTQSSFWKTHKRSQSGLTLPYSHTRLHGFGAQDAGRIWRAAMTAAIQGTPKTKFPSFTPLNTGWSSPNTYVPPSTPTAPPSAPASP